jgi:quercetin dioxygenase-like cupin family protein
MNDDHRIMSGNDAWSVLASSLQPLPPPAGGRDRLLEAIAAAAPYRTLLPGFAAVFDLAGREMHELLARINDPRAWTPGVGPMAAFLDFKPGPRLAPAHCGVARMRNGALVPQHRHRAREITFVLRGGLADGDGNTYRAGQVVDAPIGSAHSLRVIGDPDALLAVLLAEIEFDGPP